MAVARKQRWLLERFTATRACLRTHMNPEAAGQGSSVVETRLPRAGMSFVERSAIRALLEGMPQDGRLDADRLHAAILGADGKICGEVTLHGRLQLFHFAAGMNSLGYRVVTGHRFSRYALVLASPPEP
jgi:hypothetical protein